MRVVQGELQGRAGMEGKVVKVDPEGQVDPAVKVDPGGQVALDSPVTIIPLQSQQVRMARLACPVRKESRAPAA